MGTPAQGHKSYLQFGREAVYGTGVAATHRLGFVSSGVEPEIGIVRDNTLNNQVVRSSIYPVGQRARGQIEMVLDYDGLLLLFDGAFGTATFAANGGTTSGTGPYTHTFTERSLLNSYTIEIVEGNVPANKCQRLIGAKIFGFTIRGEAGQGDGALVRVVWDVLAKEKQTDQTPTASLTAVARSSVLFHQAATINDGTADAAADVRMRSFEINLGSPVHDDRFYLGSTTIDEPIRSDFVAPTMRFVKEFHTKTLIDAMKAGTTGNPALGFNSGTDWITLQMDTAKATTYTHPISGYGIITQEVTWEGLLTDAATDFGLKMTVINDQATIVT
jgi:hypothetical protein